MTSRLGSASISWACPSGVLRGADAKAASLSADPLPSSGSPEGSAASRAGSPSRCCSVPVSRPSIWISSDASAGAFWGAGSLSSGAACCCLDWLSRMAGASSTVPGCPGAPPFSSGASATLVPKCMFGLVISRSSAAFSTTMSDELSVGRSSLGRSATEPRLNSSSASVTLRPVGAGLCPFGPSSSGMANSWSSAVRLMANPT